ncbi:MAG: hypothetical protein M3P83_13535, partial [Actinomycetota bacterium]|nr:hypothetical protein [Actinomycetota bacterium]
MLLIRPELRRAVGDLVSLVRFRSAGMARSQRLHALVAAGVIATVTLVSATLPATAAGWGGPERAGDVLVLLPSACLVFVLSTTVATVAAGGGRELLARDEGVAFPVSPTTDHLGALLLAPLNLAWLLQAWSLLAATAFVVGWSGLWAAQVTMLAWLVAGTAIAQAVAWSVEWVRRGLHGPVLVRSAALLLGLGAVALVARGLVSAVLDGSPTVRVVVVALQGSGSDWTEWLVGTGVILAAGAAATGIGARLAHAVARRPPRDELGADGRTVPARAAARSE